MALPLAALPLAGKLALGAGATAGTGTALGAGALGGGLAAMGAASPAMLGTAPLFGGAAMTAGKGVMANMLAQGANPGLMAGLKSLLASGKGKLAPYGKEIDLAKNLLFPEADTKGGMLNPLEGIPKFTPVRIDRTDNQLAYNLADVLRSSSR